LRLAASAYGVFGIVLDGRLFSYHYLLPKDFEKLLRETSFAFPTVVLK